MRHLRRTRKLGWKSSHRKAALRNMVTSLLEHGRIITTVPRAKELRKIADKMVTLAKDGTLHAKRQAFSIIRDRNVVAKLFTHWREAMEHRNGGYCRLVRIGARLGDASPMTIVEMVTDSFPKSSDKKKKQSQSLSQNKIEPKSETFVPDLDNQEKPETVQNKEEFKKEEQTAIQAEENLEDSAFLAHDATGEAVNSQEVTEENKEEYMANQANAENAEKKEETDKQ